eukprot:PhF_6_TR8966/c0_g1_i1/m.14105
MFSTSLLLGKKPVIRVKSSGLISEQLKKLLNKEQYRKLKWDPLTEYEPRRLLYSNVSVDSRGAVKNDPHDVNKTYLVPDQQYSAIPVPDIYKDAYWSRETMARRVQADPYDAMHVAWDKTTQQETDFQELSMRKKFQFTVKDLMDMATKEKR